MAHGLLGFVLFLIQDGQFVVPVSLVGVNPQCLDHFRNRLVDSAVVAQRDSQVAMGIGKGGPEAHSLSEVRDRVFNSPLGHRHIHKTVVRLGKVRVQTQRLGVMDGGFAESAETRERAPTMT